MPVSYKTAGGGGGAIDAIADPGNVWEAETVFTAGHRIVVTVGSRTWVFEVRSTEGAPTDAVEPTWSDSDQLPLFIVFDAGVLWQFIGQVGEWDVGLVQRGAGFARNDTDRVKIGGMGVSITSNFAPIEISGGEIRMLAEAFIFGSPVLTADSAIATVQTGSPIGGGRLTPLVYDDTAVTGGLFGWDGLDYVKIGGPMA